LAERAHLGVPFEGLRSPTCRNGVTTALTSSLNVDLDSRVFPDHLVPYWFDTPAMVFAQRTRRYA
jgi:hypothetical protein